MLTIRRGTSGVLLILTCSLFLGVCALQAQQLPELNPPELNAPELAPPQSEPTLEPPATSEVEPTAEELPEPAGPSPLEVPPPQADDSDVTPLNVPPPRSEPEGAQQSYSAPRVERLSQRPVQVLLRGPMHEAFAEFARVSAEPNAAVAMQPPEPIDEFPPDVRPLGDDVIWIPGYWAWEADLEDFIWVCGVWRVAPPRQRWVPGYWSDTAQGYRWVNGFWLRATTDELTYWPHAPATLERGPSSLADSPDTFWVPGSWVYTEGDYQWRPGYWHPKEDENWVWVPERNVWTPRGTVHVNGHWDYALPVRGVLFAPMDFAAKKDRVVAAGFTPTHVIDTQTILLHLFVRTDDGHYGFGDYYDAARQRGGSVVPWITYWQSGGHEPLLTHYVWRYAQRGEDFAARIQGWHRYFAERPDLRPPVTYASQERFVALYDDWPQLDQTLLGVPWDQVLEEADEDSVTLLSNEERLRILGEVATLGRLALRRAQVEAPLAEGAAAMLADTLPLPIIHPTAEPRQLSAAPQRRTVLRPTTDDDPRAMLLVVPGVGTYRVAVPDQAVVGPRGVVSEREEDEPGRILGGLRGRLRQRRGR